MDKYLQLNVNTKTNLRIDKYIVENTNLSRNKVSQLFDKNLIMLNNNVVTKKNQQLNINDKITINLIQNNNKSIDPFDNIDPINKQINIIYSDKDIMILDKPSGLLVYPTNYNEPDTLAHRIAYYFKENNIFKEANKFRYGIVHRLDKDTSGLIIVAKNSIIYNQLQTMLLNNEIIRKYYAIVHNRFNENDFLFKINAPIGRVYSNETRMRVNAKKNLKEAITIVNVIENICHDLALIECELITGRTHQIRVHMQYINHPIYNDPIYGIEKHTKSYNQYLYCKNISFYHPNSKKFININLNLPDEFKQLIDLKKGNSNYE